MTVHKVVSGGQTGVDQAALRAARSLGLETGGWMPWGYSTEDGPNPGFALEYGLKPLAGTYLARTLRNIVDSDGTLVIGNVRSSGSKATIDGARLHDKPCFQLFFYESLEARVMRVLSLKPLRAWLVEQDIVVLNVAGNRESKMPGIGAWTEAFIKELLGEPK